MLLGTAFVALILSARVALAADPVCGDVTDDGSIKTTDALLVLRKSVSQPVTLDCSAYDDRFSECQSELAAFGADTANRCGQIAGAEADLAECNATLDICNGTRSSCLAALSSSNADLVFCQGELASCNDGLETCQSDLSSTDADLEYCEASPPGRIHQTGQTGCYAGELGFDLYPCGTPGLYPEGQDGNFRAGIENKFTDNGDGTVTDNRSGLMWEKLDDNNAGGIHDVDNAYAWDSIVVGKIIPLNSALFAGYNDWRVPNRNELATLVNTGMFYPAIFLEFDSACAPGCTVTSCSCTRDSSAFWSSTTHQLVPSSAWLVGFADGGLVSYPKTGVNFGVRAVRGGS